MDDYKALMEAQEQWEQSVEQLNEVLNWVLLPLLGSTWDASWPGACGGPLLAGEGRPWPLYIHLHRHPISFQLSA